MSHVAAPGRAGYGALVEYGVNHHESAYLRLAVGPGRPIAWESVPPETPRISTDENPEDMRTGESGTTFSRSDWSGGEGLDFAHRRVGTERDFTRFWSSEGIDVSPTRPGERHRLRLHRDTEAVLSAAENGATLQMVRVGTSIWWAGGRGIIPITRGVYRSDNILASIPAATLEESGDFMGLAALDEVLYASTASETWQRSLGGSWSSWSNQGAQRLWGTKNRVIGADEEDLYEIRESDESVLLYTLPDGGRWVGVVDAGAVILAAATDGNIYAFAPDEEDLELILVAQTPIPNEIPSTVGVVAGVVLVGTGHVTPAGGRVGRLWRFSLGGGLLVDGQVLREWGDATTTLDMAPRGFHASRSEAWVFRGNTLWRFDATTGGITSDLQLGTDDWGSADWRVSLVRVAGRMVIGIGFGDSSGAGIMFREATSYVGEGVLISAAADFYTAAVKQWVGARLLTDSQLAGEVLLEYSTDLAAQADPNHPSWRLIQRADGLAPGAGDEKIIFSAEGRYLLFKLTLRPGTANTLSPEVDSVSFRGLAEVVEHTVRIPVNVSDQLELPHRRRLHVKGLGEKTWQDLKRLEGADAILTIFRPEDRLHGQVVDVTTPVQEISPRGSVTVYCQLTFRGRRLAGAQHVSGAPWGMGMWGEPLWGAVFGDVA